MSNPRLLNICYIWWLQTWAILGFSKRKCFNNISFFFMHLCYLLQFAVPKAYDNTMFTGIPSLIFFISMNLDFLFFPIILRVKGREIVKICNHFSILRSPRDLWVYFVSHRKTNWLMSTCKNLCYFYKKIIYINDNLEIKETEYSSLSVV